MPGRSPRLPRQPTTQVRRAAATAAVRAAVIIGARLQLPVRMVPRNRGTRSTSVSPRRILPRMASVSSRLVWSRISAGAGVPVFVLFLVLKLYALHPAAADENVYFYMSVRTAFDGLWPYRDYFFAHPPLHILIAAAVFKLAALVDGVLHGSLAAGAAAMTSGASWSDGGLGLTIGKSIPAVSTLATGIFVYKGARRAGVIEAVLAAAAFLLADQVLRASSHFTGMAEAALFTAIGIVGVLDGHDRRAGLAFATAALVAMYAAPCAAAVWLVLLAGAPRRAWTVAVWTALPLLIVHACFLLVAGQRYWEGVFLYHLRKPGDIRTFGESFWPIFYQNAHLFFAIPTAIVAAALEACGLLGPRAAAP